MEAKSPESAVREQMETDDGYDVESLVKVADQDMYQRKIERQVDIEMA